MSCYKPNQNNPMGNFLPFDPRDKPAVCNVPSGEQFKFLNGDNFDSAFRLNFNPNPVTTSYPDITGLANYLFKDPARCRDTGYSCKTNADQTRNLDRMGFNYPGVNDKYYQEIDNTKTENNSSNIYYIGGHTN
jgi:hypothetical protein